MRIHHPAASQADGRRASISAPLKDMARSGAKLQFKFDRCPAPPRQQVPASTYPPYRTAQRPQASRGHEGPQSGYRTTRARGSGLLHRFQVLIAGVRSAARPGNAVSSTSICSASPVSTYLCLKRIGDPSGELQRSELNVEESIGEPPSLTTSEGAPPDATGRANK
ncbi:hypothetical protein BD309DRAFT_300144 [Dichomitus squalens]|nr:hypothetical protein BD309DRAFT_300144 [Dichomitus squalens]